LPANWRVRTGCAVSFLDFGGGIVATFRIVGVQRKCAKLSEPRTRYRGSCKRLGARQACCMRDLVLCA
jgi:hypothetical protein